ncbi:putative retrotransposon hot spot protein (RHS,) [Trypanosoma cruzi]|uniref:Putative retrotransposon hot spot protein (RHS,) n=1 Tax=Trypanosoma cruzi TaxID=5693 RepID=A0A2V2UI61_TRYCR|nr:putative retrotransposon hot spot protein (RHS,) [Trypanosoma cruzi]
MPPKRNRVQGGNARSRASAVPQGDRRKRARSVLEGDTDQPAATRRRAEEPQQQQLTMSSTVKDILLEGSTLRTEMKLNDFLRSNLGGRGVVDTNENVALEAFLLRPTMFINDNEILGLITALPSYQALEAINKLHHEGVYSLEQWRGFRRKNTVALLARGKINAALPRAQTSTPVVNSKVLKGCYESVYNASWHHFKEVPDSKKKENGDGNEAGEGRTTAVMDLQESWRNPRKERRCAAIRYSTSQADGAHLGQGMAVHVGGD